MSNLIKSDAQIVEVRGQKVMLDSEVAKVLGVETRALNQNAERSPKWEKLRQKGVEEDYRFQLTPVELSDMKSQNVISNEITKLPYVYTKKGCWYFSTSLNSDEACEQAMHLVDVFEAVQTGLSLSGGDDSIQGLKAQALLLFKAYERMEQLNARVADIERRQREQPAEIKRLVAESLQDDTLNVFPQGCVRLAEIRAHYFRGISSQNISSYLTHIQHPKKPYRVLTEGNVVETTMVYSEDELAEAFKRLQRESTPKNPTTKNLNMWHPVLGNYRVKIEELTPNEIAAWPSLDDN